MIVAATDKWLTQWCNPVPIRVPDLGKLILQVLYVCFVILIDMALRIQRKGCTLDVGRSGTLSQDTVQNEDVESVEAQQQDDEDEGDAGSQVEESPRPKRARVRKGSKGQGKLRKGGKSRVVKAGRPSPCLGRIIRKYDAFRSFI